MSAARFDLPLAYPKALAGSLLVLALMLAAGLAVGSADIDIGAVLASLLGGAEADPMQVSIFTSLRAPRVVLGALVGAALALAGCMMQGLFRNPLASPGIIGTSTGAALGAVLALSFGLASRSMFYLPLGAMGGALAALIAVMRIGAEKGEARTTTLLLAGVAISAFISAILSWVVSIAWEDWEASRRIAFWMLGSIADREWTHLWIALPGMLTGAFIGLRHAPELDLMLDGEEAAKALGVEVERVRERLLFGAALLTGSAVAVCGVVGFVGLVVPHTMRLLVGPGHRRLMPISIVAGAAFLLFADIVARGVARPAELHLGAVTGCVGAPFFLYLLRRHRRSLEL